MRLSCNKINARLHWGLLGTVAFALMSSESHGAPANFNVSVSPPRFELKAKPGQVVRETIRISNADTETGNYVVKTAGWTLSEKEGLTFNEGLLLVGLGSTGSTCFAVRRRRRFTYP